MRSIRSILQFASFLFCCGSALAHDCNVDDFDHTAPIKVQSRVDNLVSKFEWVTDVDLAEGLHWRCNCIINRDEKGWSGNWIKGGVRAFTTNKLPPGKPLCNGEAIGPPDEALDTDAPIEYGASGEIQNAAIYVAKTGPDANSQAGLWSSKLTSEFLDSKGGLVPVSVDINVINKGDQTYSLSIETSPGLTASIAQIDRIMSPSQFKVLSTDNNSVGLVSDLSAWQAGTLPFDQMIFDKGAALLVNGSVNASIPNEQDTNISSQVLELTVFDEARQPIAASLVKLPTMN